MATNRYVPRRIQSSIYKLKRLFGGTISVYKGGTPVTDLETGVKTWENRQVTVIERAVILPVKFDRFQVQSISVISSAKDFVYGGMLDKGSRWFYIDPRDLADGFEIKRDDWIVYQGKQYELELIHDTEFDSLWEIKGVEMPGVVPQQIHLLSGSTVVSISHTASGVI